MDSRLLPRRRVGDAKNDAWTHLASLSSHGRGFRGGRCLELDPSLDARRPAWERKQWRLSERGSWFVNVRGLNVTVFATRRGWGIKVEQRFATAAKAKAKAFEALVWAEQNWPGNSRHPVAPQGARA
jgi:hypothetical protein